MSDTASSTSSWSEASSTPRSDAEDGEPAGGGLGMVRRCSPGRPARLKTSPAALAANVDATLNADAAARWGTLVGQILFKQVLDFSAVGDKMIQHRKIMQQSRQKYGNVLNSVRGRARAVVDQVRQLAKRIEREEQDCYDSEWSEEGLTEHLFSTEAFDTVMLLAKAAQKILAAQPTLVDIKAPCKIFGDIHGQLRDMLLLFRAFGSPDDTGAPAFVFNGDFVDRGSHQVEVICVLLAFKVLLPERVWLIRGNHEEREMNSRYGFSDSCVEIFGKSAGAKVFDSIQNVFNHLPMGCLVSKKILIVHGGIGNGAWRLSDLRNIKRPLDNEALTDPAKPWLNHILWSDPIEDDQKSMEATFGVHMSPRGRMGLGFAWNVTTTFCAVNGIGLIVRSHQSKMDSISFDVMHDGHLVRVFSARDYEGHGNDGAVLVVSPSLAHKGLLTVRLQVLRSVTKARDEAQYYKMERRVQKEMQKEGAVAEGERPEEDLVVQAVKTKRRNSMTKRQQTLEMAERHLDRRVGARSSQLFRRLFANGKGDTADS